MQIWGEHGLSPKRREEKRSNRSAASHGVKQRYAVIERKIALGRLTHLVVYADIYINDISIL